jgi:hypothetical protein
VIIVTRTFTKTLLILNNVCGKGMCDLKIAECYELASISHHMAKTGVTVFIVRVN